MMAMLTRIGWTPIGVVAGTILILLYVYQLGAADKRAAVEAATRSANAACAVEIAGIAETINRAADERVAAAESAVDEPLPADLVALCASDPYCRKEDSP